MITSDELFEYLRQTVDDWSREHRATSQTVSVWGDDSRFDVMAVRTPATLEDTETAEKKHEASAAADRIAGEPASVAKAGTPSPSPAGDTQAEPNTSSSPPPKAQRAVPPEPELTLIEAWRRRAALAQRVADVVASAPHQLRLLDAQLLMADEQHRAGYDSAEESSLRVVKRLFAEIDRERRPAAVVPEDANWHLTLGLWSRVAKPTLRKPEEFRALVAELAQQSAAPMGDAAPGSGSPSAVAPAAAGSLLASADERWQFARFLVDESVSARNIQQLQMIAGALSQLDRSRLWPQAEWPAELIAAAEFSSAAAADVDREGDWRRLLQITSRWYDVAANASLQPDVIRLIEPTMTEAGRSLLASERRSARGAATEALARVWLVRADDAVDRVQAMSRELGDLVSLEQEITARLPDLMGVVAEQGELDRSRRYDPLRGANWGECWPAIRRSSRHRSWRRPSICGRCLEIPHRRAASGNSSSCCRNCLWYGICGIP